MAVHVRFSTWISVSLKDLITDVAEVVGGAVLHAPDAVAAVHQVYVHGAAAVEQETQLQIGPGKTVQKRK